MDNVERLDNFRREVSIALACGVLADESLPVTGDDGSCPVVVALADETLSALLGRLRAVGGFANLFIKFSEGSVSMLSVLRDECAIADADDDMTQPGDRPHPDSTVGAFAEHVANNPNGVTISSAFAYPALARDARNVDFAPA